VNFSYPPPAIDSTVPHSARIWNYWRGGKDNCIRQFLDIGTGVPTQDNTHQVAHRVAPTSRIVYVDNDPLVLSHAAALLRSGPVGATVSGSRVAADVSTDAMTRRMASGDGQDAAMISGVTTDPTAGTPVLALKGGLATTQFTPAVADGKLQLPVTGGEVFGSAAPQALLDRVQTAVDALPTQDGPE
jgi:hypothetical protein